jgi:hypothetical protein
VRRAALLLRGFGGSGGLRRLLGLRLFGGGATGLVLRLLLLRVGRILVCHRDAQLCNAALVV